MSGQRARFWIRTAGLTAILLGCSSGESTGPGGGGTSVNQYLSSLPGWDQFSPPGAVTDSLVDSTRTPTSSRDTVPVVNQIDSLGNVITRQNVAYACSSVPYTISKNPRELVIYNPDVDILFPGGLIQGRSHKSPVGSLLPLTIAERTPVNVSIPGVTIPGGTNFRTVDIVDQAHVASAVSSIVGNATLAGLQAPSASTFEMRTYNSEQEFALQAGLSGKYLGFSGSASGSINRNASETTVAVHFYQRMFDVVVGAPQTPAAFFSSAFTPAKLQEQVNLGRVGPDNLPVYVSQVTYGRMMMFTLTSSASESDIRATLNVSYRFVTGQAGLSLDTRQRKILSEAKIAITAIGGNDSATAAMIQTGDWRSYFTSSAPLSSAAPISYTFRNLGDGSLAQVTEATNYTIRTCTEYATLPGQFIFTPLQSVAAPVSTPFETLLSDVNGDGIQDLIWNHRDPASNQVAFALGSSGGLFGAPTVASHPVTAPEGWGNYRVVTGDFNGDGKSDLAWSYLGTANKSYTALSTGSGWSFAAEQLRPENNWGPYRVLVGDTDGDGDDDLIFNQTAAGNRTYVNLSNGDGTYDMSHPGLDAPIGGSWAPYLAQVGDINADGRDDLIWNSSVNSTANWTYTGRFNSDGVTYQMPAGQQHYTVCCWQSYQRLVGDFNGDGRSDLFFSNTAGTARALHGALANGSGSWTFLNPALPVPLSGTGTFVAYVGDIDGDGFADLMWNQLTATANTIQTGRGKSDGRPEISPADQVHPTTTNWSQAVTRVGDVTGDGRDDVVWVIPGATVQIYVGVAEP